MCLLCEDPKCDGGFTCAACLTTQSIDYTSPSPLPDSLEAVSKSLEKTVKALYEKFVKTTNGEFRRLEQAFGFAWSNARAARFSKQPVSGHSYDSRVADDVRQLAATTLLSHLEAATVIRNSMTDKRPDELVHDARTEWRRMFPGADLDVWYEVRRDSLQAPVYYYIYADARTCDDSRHRFYRQFEADDRHEAVARTRVALQSLLANLDEVVGRWDERTVSVKRLCERRLTQRLSHITGLSNLRMSFERNEATRLWRLEVKASHDGKKYTLLCDIPDRYLTDTHDANDVILSHVDLLASAFARGLERCRNEEEFKGRWTTVLPPSVVATFLPISHHGLRRGDPVGFNQKGEVYYCQPDSIGVVESVNANGSVSVRLKSNVDPNELVRLEPRYSPPMDPIQIARELAIDVGKKNAERRRACFAAFAGAMGSIARAHRDVCRTLDGVLTLAGQQHEPVAKHLGVPYSPAFDELVFAERRRRIRAELKRRADERRPHCQSDAFSDLEEANLRDA